MTKGTYRFKDKDLSIDAARSALEKSGKKLKEVVEESRLSPSTPNNWFNGDTLHPTRPAMRKFMDACGYRLEEHWVSTHDTIKVNYRRVQPSFRIIRR